MQRFINDPDFVVEDTVRGFVKAHSDLVKLGGNPKVVAAAEAPILPAPRGLGVASIPAPTITRRACR